MAQANYTPIQLYRTATAAAEPTAGNLTYGELAINYADGKIFYKNSSNAIRLLAIGYASSTVTPTAGGVQYGTGSAVAFTAAGTSNQVLISNGSSAPTWANLSSVGVSTFSAGTTGFTPNSATAGAVTLAGTLATTNGGTGLTSFTANGVVYASSSSVLTTGSALTFDGTNFATTGTASATKLIPTGGAATGNGMYLPTANELAWSNNGSETMRLTSTGLGIGTSSPAYKLDVQTSAGRFQVQNYGAGSVLLYSNGVLAYNAATTRHEWQVAGSTLMQLESSGNLGLGVTPSSAGASYKTFQLFDLTSTGIFASSYAANLTANAYLNSGTWTRGGNSYAPVKYAQFNGAHTWSTAAAAGTTISWTDAMTLDAGGNLLVGATSLAFAEKFQMYGNYAVFNNASYTGFIGQGSALGTATASDFAIRSSNALAFLTGGATERARIDSSGNLLVGTTSNGGTNAKFEVDYAGGYGAALVNTDNSSASKFYAFYNSTFGECGSIARVTTTNAVTYNTTSDYRLKNFVAKVTDSGARLDALRPVEFTWKADGQRARGFFAHEFQQVYTQSVTGTKDAVDEDGKPVYQAMQASTAEVIADLVAEIQSLRARVAALESN